MNENGEFSTIYTSKQNTSILERNSLLFSLNSIFGRISSKNYGILQIRNLFISKWTNIHELISLCWVSSAKNVTPCRKRNRRPITHHRQPGSRPVPGFCPKGMLAHLSLPERTHNKQELKRDFKSNLTLRETLPWSSNKGDQMLHI